MPFVVVWTADVETNETNGQTTRMNSRRVGLHTDQIALATEHSITSGEVYVKAVMADGWSIDIFEQTLDTLRELDRAPCREATSQPMSTPNPTEDRSAEIRRRFQIVGCILSAAETKCHLPDELQTLEDLIDQYGRYTDTDRSIAAPYLDMTLRQLAEAK